MTLSTRYDVVIVGGGHNGLVAAAYLASAGQSVLVLERNDYIGGATASTQVFPEYAAQLSRYSYLVSLLPSQIVEDLDLAFETRRRKTASFTAYRDNAGNDRGLVLSNVDDARSQASMHEMTGSDAAWGQYQRFLNLEAALAEVIWPSFLEPLRTRGEFVRSLRTAEQREAWQSFVDQPLGVALERHAEHDALRGLLLTDGKIGVFTHPHDPSLLQNRCFLYHVVGQGTGEWRVPVGGMRALVHALMQRCVASGVTMLTDAPVHRVHAGGAAHSVVFHQDGREQTVDAERVIFNCGPKAQARLLGLAWAPTPTDEGSVIKVNMLLQRLPRLKAPGVEAAEAFSGSFHIDEGYEQMRQSYRMAAEGQLPDPAPAEIYCHTLTDDSILSPELRAKGYQTLTLFGLDMPYRLFREDHDARKARVLASYLEGLNRLTAEPFEECLARNADGSLCVEIKTPQDLERDVDLDLGNIFHNTLTWPFVEDEALAGTWGTTVTAHERMYVCGSSALRGGAVSGIPGRNAAMQVMEELRIHT